MASTTVALSKKLSNGNRSFPGAGESPSKKMFGGSRAVEEDYGEIFGGSGASIPFLDVPELSESKVSVDVRSSKLDYSKIFGGGFADSSYSMCHDEISLEPNTRKKFEEECTPAERSSPSQSSENSRSTEGSRDLSSPELSNQVVNGANNFCMSYNKVSHGNANGKCGTNGTTHIAQLNAVRGYAHLIDELATPIHRTGEGVKPVISVAQENESSPKGNISRGGIEEAGNSVRASVDALAGEMRKQTPGSGVVEAQIQNTANLFKSYSMGKTVNRNEVGNGTYRPKVPSSSCSLPRNFNLGNNDSKTWGDEGSTSGYSPPHFEEEVDTNSVAATSAAALRKAIDDAQARIKVAKEIMERKKAGQRNGTKSFSHRLKPEEGKEDKVANGVNLSKKKTTLEGVDIILRSAGTSEKNTAVQTPCKEIPRHTIHGETPSKEIPSQLWEEAEVSEAEQFYDAENTSENWSPTVEVDTPQDSVVRRGKNVVVLARETENCEVKQIVSGGKASDKEVLFHKLKPTEAEHRHEKTEPAKAAEDGVNKSADKLIQKERKRWNKPNQTVELGRTQSVDKTAQIDMKTTNEFSDHPQPCGEGPKLADGGDTQDEILRRIKLLNGSVGASDSESESASEKDLILDVKVLNHEKNEPEQLFTLKLGGYVEAEKEVNERESSERSSMEDGKALEMMGTEDMKHMERELVTRECPESEAGEEYGKQEEQKDQNDAHGWEENKEILISHKFQLGKEIAKILSHDDETEATEKIFGESASWKEENENIEESSGAQVPTRTNAGSNIVEGDKDEVKPAVEEEIKEVPVEEPENQGLDIGADRLSNKDESDNHSETQEPVLQSQSDETFEASEEVLVCKGGGETFKKLSEAFLESDDSMKVKEAMEEKNVLQMDDFLIGSELIKMMKPVEDKTESVLVKENGTTDEGRIDSSFVQDPKDEPSGQMEMVDDSREYSEEMVSEVANVDEYIRESEASANLEGGENNVDCFEGQECVDDGTLVKDRQSPGICEGAENVEHEEETSTSTSEEKDHESCKEIPISQKTDVNDSHQETHLSQSADTNDESRIETPMSQKAEVNDPRKETLLSQSAGTNEENDRVAAPVKEKTHNESLQKEAKVEKEHQRRVDATKERDREIEKGRMAVERAVREARERALAEARERAASEKAATAARRRGAGEAPEKVGQTSGEAGAKHVAEKSSREAKLKAERAAVERATAEARARAFEKAMSSKAASDARKQNLEPKGNTSSRYPSSNHEVSNSTDKSDKSDGANGESAQRCKARSERHQRISERAEKALAEKNRRDLLVQREQTERNRLAETLDIEVKRWSNGKEGNLRALLSTLQYILGPDSGWQPIPLTEIIKTAAVKKAYRKATLSVHPDKLQQRGANIQQKYICEKVFDLLKEAWNKFNVEER